MNKKSMFPAPVKNNEESDALYGGSISRSLGVSDERRMEIAKVVFLAARGSEFRSNGIISCEDKINGPAEWFVAGMIFDQLIFWEEKQEKSGLSKLVEYIFG